MAHGVRATHRRQTPQDSNLPPLRDASDGARSATLHGILRRRLETGAGLVLRAAACCLLLDGRSWPVDARPLGSGHGGLCREKCPRLRRFCCRRCRRVTEPSSLVFKQFLSHVSSSGRVSDKRSLVVWFRITVTYS